jgi:predicted ATPase
LPGSGGSVVELGRGDPTVQLHAIAGRGRCLVILDNFDQVAGLAETTVGRWAETARAARFLVTSRERLDLGAAHTLLEVEPLPPAQGEDLFITRAGRLRPGLALDAVAGSVRDIVGWSRACRSRSS